jgi:Calcium-binding EGF domain
VERINKVLQGVVDVEVEWNGADLHGRVGEHMVRCKVTRLADAVSSDNVPDDVHTDAAGRSVRTQCFHVPFTILDTNECTLPRGHAMRHQCQSPAICVNTIGSYECVCPRLEQSAKIQDYQSTTANDSFWSSINDPARSAWEVSFSSASRTSCPSSASTHGCCPHFVHIEDTGRGSCRASFKCPTDPCASDAAHECASSATCIRLQSPMDQPNYKCQCPEGLMGNGRVCRRGDAKPTPKVMFDGVTPTEETVRNNMYCDCTRPVVDACSGFPPCQGKSYWECMHDVLVCNCASCYHASYSRLFL